ncbi:uncharacterized protein HHUB_1576 [Halobacterium hubeiense]|uniref:PH domain-containing protein n=1 Tax=Halobacterium hubeiense TaxID=1407499 RepID=A0A0U5H0P4_9EURY|nr:uncharacterized protein HHUB_1576 [Halobacterium hubeiense]
MLIGATRPPVTEPTGESEHPDTTYAFVVGLYAGVVGGPAAVLAVSPWLRGAGALYVALLVAVTGLATAVGWAAARAPGLGVRLGGRTAVWLFAVAPFAWVAGVAGAEAVGVEVPSVAAVFAMLATAGGGLLGLAVVAMSHTRYADWTTRDAVELAAWEARWPKRWRQAAIAVVLVSFVAGAGGVGAEALFGVEDAGTAYLLALFAVPLASLTTAPRTLRATDAGLVVERPHQRRFRPWSAFSGYDATADALVLRSAAWWRVDVRCDRGDVGDVEAATAALDDALGSARQ